MRLWVEMCKCLSVSVVRVITPGCDGAWHYKGTVGCGKSTVSVLIGSARGIISGDQSATL